MKVQPDKVFKRDGADISVDVSIPFTQVCPVLFYHQLVFLFVLWCTCSATNLLFQLIFVSCLVTLMNMVFPLVWEVLGLWGSHIAICSRSNDLVSLGVECLRVFIRPF